MRIPASIRAAAVGAALAIAPPIAFTEAKRRGSASDLGRVAGDRRVESPIGAADMLEPPVYGPRQDTRDQTDIDDGQTHPDRTDHNQPRQARSDRSSQRVTAGASAAAVSE